MEERPIDPSTCKLQNLSLVSVQNKLEGFANSRIGLSTEKRNSSPSTMYNVPFNSRKGERYKSKWTKKNWERIRLQDSKPKLDGKKIGINHVFNPLLSMFFVQLRCEYFVCFYEVFPVM